ncbi:LysR substrate-binding domain-containing protein [Herbiconiux sp. CPCC 203407]|uniref:LysR substrate-binding domain-containing protein n=1 Tax=Herbiconiux oxytropis TaxID=2970915 RepID=A0AA42BTW6_9MICO|nr:LysR family transcriptional regulator [Herbiconiux oxytropis]MCS5723041.1 LysR substrate-binding domain-containing protein [Herbiconiux oxytropis]MCS5726890.1 LysR substrate-binding domain-containing protein [Herbiconiux oxytropis]
MNLRSIDLNLLVSLDALLNESSVSRAAERMLVGQPAMSATLARLRALFDNPLLVRVGRELRLTPFAEALREPLTDVLTGIEAVVNSGVAFDPATSSRTFTVMASDYVALVLLRPLMERLRNVAPGVRLVITPVGPDLLMQLGRSQTDAVVVPREILPPRLDLPHETLFEDTFVCVTDAAVLTEPDSAFTVEDLTAMPYLQSNQGQMTTLVDGRLRALGIQRDPEVVTTSFVMAPFLLPGTNLFTVVQRRLALELMGDDARYRIFPPPVNLGVITETMVWSPRHGADPGHRWLRGQLGDLASAGEHRS